MKITTPQQAARQILDATQQRKSKVVIGPDARFMDVAVRLFPDNLWRFLARVMKMQMSVKTARKNQMR